MTELQHIDRQASSDQRFTEAEMITLSASAMRKVDTRGMRGVERVTHEEIVALILFVHLMSSRMAAIQTAFENEETTP